MTIERLRERKIKRKQVDVIPAQPGFNLVFPIYDREIVDVWREPILAWRVETIIHEGRDPYSSTWPITTEGDIAIGIHENWAVESPDGRCCIVGDRSFDNAAELLKYWQPVTPNESARTFTN